MRLISPRLWLSVLVLPGFLAVAPILGAQVSGAQVSTPNTAGAQQVQTQQNTTQSAIANLEPQLNRVGEAVSGLNVERWKTSKGLRDATSSDVESIEQDLGKTLPALIDQAAASGDQVAPGFAVYRNVGALYDVLLRVTFLANFAGSRDEARSLENARAALEAAQVRLSKALLAAATAQDASLVRLRKAARRRPQPPLKTIIINDGPVRKHAGHGRSSNE